MSDMADQQEHNGAEQQETEDGRTMYWPTCSCGFVGVKTFGRGRVMHQFDEHLRDFKKEGQP